MAYMAPNIQWAQGGMHPVEEIKSSIEGDLKKILWLAPDWLSNIYLRFEVSNEDDPDTYAAIHTNYPYRSITIFIYGRWINQEPGERLRTLLHEMLHVHTGVVQDYMEAALSKIAPASEYPALNGIVMEELKNKSEASTEDLANVIYRKLYSF